VAGPLFTTRAGLRAGGSFFIRIRRNPLKSADSAKEKQGNPNLFAWFHLVSFGFIWFYLVFLAFPWRKFSRQVAIRS
jgi:hypothetical protein